MNTGIVSHGTGPTCVSIISTNRTVGQYTDQGKQGRVGNQARSWDIPEDEKGTRGKQVNYSVRSSREKATVTTSVTTSVNHHHHRQPLRRTIPGYLLIKTWPEKQREQKPPIPPLSRTQKKKKYHPRNGRNYHSTRNRRSEREKKRVRVDGSPDVAVAPTASDGWSGGGKDSRAE